jgi:proline iminopeptidase
MRDFYPEIEPYDNGYLRVSDIHELYYEQVGNPQGYPVVVLHGGPGGGFNSDLRRYFDPDFYRVILFDQRGCGKSRPFADLRENTTWDLVADTEKLREHVGIEAWHVFGGSWGSTLALTYAISHPTRVTALILRGIFLCRPSELRWFYQDGASQIFADAWEPYYNYIPETERGDFISAYYQRLTSPIESVRLEAARIWSRWEMATSYLIPKPLAIERMDNPANARPFARIECHYFINNAFFPTDNYIIDNIEKIRHIPGFIVQGRYDVVCPMKSAWDLHRAWPEATLQIIPDSGHASAEPGTRSALITALDSFRI